MFINRSTSVNGKGCNSASSNYVGDERTYRICCDGVYKGCVIAIGIHGTTKGRRDRYYLLNGVERIIEILHPSAIVIYGTAHDKYYQKYRDMGIAIHQFNSDYSKIHSKEAD